MWAYCFWTHSVQLSRPSRSVKTDKSFSILRKSKKWRQAYSTSVIFRRHSDGHQQVLHCLHETMRCCYFHALHPTVYPPRSYHYFRQMSSLQRFWKPSSRIWVRKSQLQVAIYPLCHRLMQKHQWLGLPKA